MIKQKLSGPALHRAATAGIANVNADARTFDLSFASDDVQVLRSNWFDDPWLETLGLNPDEVDLSRLDSGAAPLLWMHDQFDRDNTIGVVKKASVANGRGLATVQLSKRSDLDGLWQDIVDGVVTNVSTGYKVNERTLTKSSDTAPDEYRVTAWQPFEISLVSIPADDTVGIGRAQPNDALRFTIINEDTMDTTIQNDPAAKPENNGGQSPAAVVTRSAPEGGENQPPIRKVPVEDPVREDGTQIRAAATRAERERIAQITTLSTRAKLPAETLKKAIDDGTSVEAFRNVALESLFDQSNQTQSRSHIVVAADEVDKQRGQLVDVLLSRMGQMKDGDKAINLQGNEFRGMSLLEIGADRLRVVGENTRGLDRMELAKRAITNSTSDFSIVLGLAFNKVLLAAYNAIPDTWRQFCKTGTLSDFRLGNRYRMGNFGSLDVVPEGGEYKYGTLADAEKNPVSLATKGKMFSVTRQLLINDDLGALTDILQLMGRGAKRGIEIDVYAALALNSGNGPVLNDTIQLFNASHSNLAGSGAAPSITTIPAAQQAMQSQVYGNDYIDISPSIFLASIATAAAMKVLNASAYDPTVNKFQAPNPVYQAFATIIGSPRISGNGWYLFADPSVEPVLEVDFLNGVQEPYTEQRDGWNVDGIEYKVRFDYGVNAVGFRGAYRNPGA